MISLFIDTCTSNLIVSLIKDTKILSNYNEYIKTDLSVKIVPVMQDIFSKAKITPNDVDHIFITNGPGSFTGIRMGVTVAKTFAWALNKQITPISSLECIATTPVKEDYIVPIIDARRDYVYAGIYNEHLDVIMNDQYISIEQLKKEIKDKNVRFISYDEFESIDSLKPKIDIIKIVEKHKKDQGLNPHKVNPNYLKLTEAEMSLKQ